MVDLRYKKYLESEQWQKLRSERLKIDDYTCQRCGKSYKGLQVHHITYENIFHEDVYNDLLTLCNACHRHIEEAKKEDKQKDKELAELKRKDESNKRVKSKKTKRCPFCGSNAYVFVSESGKYIVRCGRCNAMVGMEKKTIKSAVKIWNRRVNNDREN